MYKKLAIIILCNNMDFVVLDNYIHSTIASLLNTTGMTKIMIIN